MAKVQKTTQQWDQIIKGFDISDDEDENDMQKLFEQKQQAQMKKQKRKSLMPRVDRQENLAAGETSIDSK